MHSSFRPKFQVHTSMDGTYKYFTNAFFRHLLVTVPFIVLQKYKNLSFHTDVFIVLPVYIAKYAN
jgi:hypothetical protein